MHRRSVMTMGLLTLGASALGGARVLAAPAAKAPMRSSGKGWITLFDGTSLAGWTAIGDANWRLEDGAAVADKGNGFLVSKDSYGDVEIKAELWVNDTANSGVFIRCADPNQITGSNAYEVNVFDQRPDPSYGTGAIVNVAKVVPMPKAANKWNTLDITARGPRLSVALNGKRTVNGAVDYRHATGWIALQYGKGVVDTGVVKFRKVQIRQL